MNENLNTTSIYIHIVGFRDSKMFLDVSVWDMFSYLFCDLVQDKNENVFRDYPNFNQIQFACNM